jgi:hypothetical protein
MHNFALVCILSKLCISGKNRYVGILVDLMQGYIGSLLCNYVLVQISYLGCTWFGPGVHFCIDYENWQIISIVILTDLDFTVEDLF